MQATFRNRLALLCLLACASLAATGRAQTPPTTKPEKALPALREGDSGEAVEILQRALNKRLDPDQALSVDGDFGPATRKAVSDFQRSQKMNATGIVDARTWEALGPLPKSVAPTPDPVPELAPKQPPDPLEGPPFVSVKAWVIMDAQSGEVLAGKKEADILEMASTTKMMTAYVILRMARSDPSLLDQAITFSERADKTGGSTSGIHAGEKLPVRELMYGLLLPSGNDASVALGEYFGAKLLGNERGDALGRFIEEMNAQARELGLKETHYANTHGLSVPDHRSSVRDLAMLARKALAEPVFAECVRTRRHIGTVTDGGGKTRQVVWNNTNRLLGTEGYDGVKTGSTGAAGSCLVASGRRDNDHLIVAVLGGASSDSRDADVRNLFRWAWLQKRRPGQTR
jgi:D-alanyl-D-alanine carboxypeptidase (penicillin-binding protein 5/6)